MVLIVILNSSQLPDRSLLRTTAVWSEALRARPKQRARHTESSIGKLQTRPIVQADRLPRQKFPCRGSMKFAAPAAGASVPLPLVNAAAVGRD